MYKKRKAGTPSLAVFNDARALSNRRPLQTSTRRLTVFSFSLSLSLSYNATFSLFFSFNATF
jgi:hypothetical protein